MSPLNRIAVAFLISISIGLTGCGGGGSEPTSAISNTTTIANRPANIANIVNTDATTATLSASPVSASIFPQLAHIVHMGQSLGSGGESFPVITTRDTGYGNFQFARGIHTWREEETDYCKAPEARPASDFELAPIIAGEAATLTGETIASGLADQLKLWLGGTDTRFLVSFTGQGSRRLRDMDKRHDDAKDPRSAHPTAGGHYPTSIDDVRRAKAQAAKRGWSYGVAAITWMQGEAENDYKLNDWTQPLERNALLSTYAADLINLKNDWNEDIIRVTGQTKRVPMFTYQTQGAITGQAQLMATDLDPEITMVSPTYYMYSSLNSVHGFNSAEWGHAIHITGESERWLGAQFAKVMKRVMVDKQPWHPLRPIKAWFSADRKTVYVQYWVPKPPLVIDTDFLPAVQGAGFSIPGGPAVTGAKVVAPDTLALTLSTEASQTTSKTLQYAAGAAATQMFQLPSPIHSVRAGEKWSNGQNSFEVVFLGDIRPLFKTALKAGVFYLQNNLDGPKGARAVIRSVALDAEGNTVLKGESRELMDAIEFKKGQLTTANTIFAIGNLRDSDDTSNLYRFETGPRAGQAYPLWNWSVSYQDLAISIH